MVSFFSLDVRQFWAETTKIDQIASYIHVRFYCNPNEQNEP